MRERRHGFPFRRYSLLAAALLVAGTLGCQKAAAPPAAREAAAREESKKEPFTVELAEKPAFPLEKHLESKEIAAGSMQFPQLFEAGDELFHTPYNGLDGVGMKTLAGKA